MNIKLYICTVFGAIGAMIINLFGGIDVAIATLTIFMAIDYVTGLMVGITNNSLKTTTGGLNSSVGFKGLCKKCMILVMVIVAVRVDIMLGTDYIRNVVIVGYTVNELISITENTALLGVPVPLIIIKMIDVIKQKEGV